MYLKSSMELMKGYKGPDIKTTIQTQAKHVSVKNF